MTTDTINVLDHGFVRMIDRMGGDLSVVRAARVSYDAAWRAGEDDGSDAKLIRPIVPTVVAAWESGR
jgi:thymidylate synthase (FAD)